MRSRDDDAGPNIPEPGISELQESVLGLLEEAGMPQHRNDQIVRIIEEWERETENMQKRKGTH